MTRSKRMPMIAGNWKMNLTVKEGVVLVKGLLSVLPVADDREVVVAPAFTSLCEIGKLVKDGYIKLAAQNMSWERQGAYTGEISPVMLKEIGCDYVILGHSERRHIFKETDAEINKKVLTALKEGLSVIFCLGETLEERKQGNAIGVIERQAESGLKGVTEDQIKDVVIAYEPVWAIGTGETASPEQAQEVHSFIRGFLSKRFGLEVANSCRVVYGGSVKPDNVDRLMAQPDIDGALVGGASLKIDSFSRIVQFKGF